jgi:hypothetical protein
LRGLSLGQLVLGYEQERMLRQLLWPHFHLEEGLLPTDTPESLGVDAMDYGDVYDYDDWDDDDDCGFPEGAIFG